MPVLKRTVQLSAIVLLTASILLLASRNRLIELATPLLLEQAGFQSSHLQGVSLTMTGCAFQEFSVSRDLPVGRVAVAAKNIRLGFTASELINGRVESLVIDSLDITRTAPPSQAAPRQAFTVEQLLEHLEELGAKGLPIDSVAVRRLRLHTAELGPLAGKPLSALLQHTPVGLQFKTNYQQTDKTVYQLKAELDNQGSAKLELQIRDKDTTPMEASLAITRRGITGHIDGSLDRLDLIQPLINLPMPELQGTVSADLTVDRTSSRPALQVEVTASQLQYGDMQARRLELSLDLTRFSDATAVNLGPSSRLTASDLRTKRLSAEQLKVGLAGQVQRLTDQYIFNFTRPQPWQADGILGPGIKVKQLTITPPEGVVKQGDSIHFRTSTPLTITALQISRDKLHIPKLTLRPGQDNSETTMTSTGQGWTVQTGQWQTDSTTLSMGFMTLDSTPLQLQVEQVQKKIASPLSAALNFSTETIALADNVRQLQFHGMEGRLQLRESRLTGAFSWGLGDIAGTLQAALSHNLNNSSGTASLQTKPTLALDGNSLTQGRLLNPLQLPVTLEKGILGLQVRADWAVDRPLQLYTEVQLTQGSGSIRELPFSGLTIRHNLQILPQLKSAGPGSISLARVNGLIPVEAIGLQLALQPSDRGIKPKLILQNLGCQLLGGSIDIERVVYDFNRPDPAFTIQLEGINLRDLLALQQVKGLDVSGRVNGSLPVSLTREGFSINKGEVQNAPGGGTIHYQPPNGSLGKSQLTGYALKALEEFHYHLLKAVVGYAADGNLFLSVHLQGNSPRLETRRPVHLNINAEQNLLSLLQSLKYSKSLTDELDTQVQQHYRKPPGN